MQKGFLLVLAVGGLHISSPVSAFDKGVYGDDDRKEVFDLSIPSEMRAAARSTAAVVNKDKLHQLSESQIQLQTETFKESYGLCEGETFENQPSVSDCSAFLVAPDIMISAGHCFQTASDCDNSAFVFDYAYYTPFDQPDLFSAEQIYHCKEIVDVDLDDETGLDFAIIRLERRVSDREPLDVASASLLEPGDEVTAIGNPSGLPTKIAGGAKVRSASNNYWFSANLDTFEGSSGSAILAASGSVEGILVRGDIDFRFDMQEGCSRVRRCADDDCDGEAVTKISAFYDRLEPYLWHTTSLAQIL